MLIKNKKEFKLKKKQLLKKFIEQNRIKFAFKLDLNYVLI